ncbi:MAG: Ureidoglycolate lyase [Planctomycetota bacterium]|nr:Ureidoglycolate lyase [Planctomycetota bacterium]
MRLCRFLLEDEMLLGFYADRSVVPIDAACAAYEEATGQDLVLASGEDLLELLPPDGHGAAAIRVLSGWIETLGHEDRDALNIPLDQVEILVPVPHPRKILLLAGNYSKHVEERGGTAAERAETFPYVFLKPPSTTLTNPDDPIVIPKVSPDHVDWECELAVVIGRECRDVPEAEALTYVAGYTILNDISDRKFAPNPDRKPRERDKFFDWLHGKWHDTFCPMGPCLLSAEDVDPQDLRIRLKVNGELKQDASTAQMVFPVAAVISFLSSFVTLEPGDIISTGTPSGVGSATGTYLKDGDVVEAIIEGIGVLRNPVVRA